MPISNHRNAATRWFGRSADLLLPIERRILESARQGTTIARDVNAHFKAQSTVGERLSDRIAEIGGSWSFILSFLGFLVLWVIVNTLLLTRQSFDPYPFIFLNLILSMLAAIQAPIIMMSQNRAAARDRLDASHNYEVNLKAEIEILALHDKFDAIRDAELKQIAETLVRITDRLARLEGAGSSVSNSTLGSPPT